MSDGIPMPLKVVVQIPGHTRMRQSKLGSRRYHRSEYTQTRIFGSWGGGTRRMCAGAGSWGGGVPDDVGMW